MFKSGDRVVCIDKDEYFGYENDLCKTYTIHHHNVKYDYICLVGCDFIHQPKNFISIKEYRKLKLKKLCLTQETE